MILKTLVLYSFSLEISRSATNINNVVYEIVYKMLYVFAPKYISTGNYISFLQIHITETL